MAGPALIPDSSTELLPVSLRVSSDEQCHTLNAWHAQSETSSGAVSPPKRHVTVAGDCPLSALQACGRGSQAPCPVSHGRSGELRWSQEVVGFLNLVPRLPASQPSVTTRVAYFGSLCDPELPEKRQE